MTSALFLLLWVVSQASGNQLPRVFLLDTAQLAQEREMAEGHSDQADDFLKAARAEADKAKHAGPFSVTQKTITPPSGDKHDYMSWAPYFWPNPNTPNHLPYIRRDGEHNPEIKQIPDHDNMFQMCSAVHALALGYYLTGSDDYAAHAALLLRTWFLDPATKMNPNLEFAQGIRGINTGRGIGLIESRALTQVVDGVGLLEGSKNWSAADDQSLHQWFTSFLEWMRTSQHGQDESRSKNNHGSYYDEQVADFALFVGKREIAEEVLKQVPEKRIAVQIEPNGAQPLELARTNSWGYSNFNLRALAELAILGKLVGVDLWQYQTADGRSMRKALDYLLPYATGEKPWPYQQITVMHRGDLAVPLREAAKAFHNPEYEAAAQKLSAAH
jgi:Alginate lyase